MTNYAEQLAYWYLRLNGFFLISNYVYHQIREGDEARAYNADADLLALRPPHYYEEIPNREIDDQGNVHYLLAPLKSDDWLDKFKFKWLGVIVEVKGSENAQLAGIRRAFSPNRLKVSVNRLGFLPNAEAASMTLRTRDRFDYGESSILKIVFSQVSLEGPWMNILLDEANEFIIDRMSSTQNYLVKTGSRYFFPSDLIQYMIWSANRQNRQVHRPRQAGFFDD